MFPQESGYENETVLLSGTNPISLHELAHKLNHLLPPNKKKTLKVSQENEYCAHNFAQHEDWLLHAWATTYKALARGELETVDPLLQNLLGRELKSFDETLREMILGSEDSGAQVMEQYAK